MNFSTISRRHCDSVTAAWLIGHLKPGPPAIYPFHTRLFIHSLKQDKGSRLPALNRQSLTFQSINQSLPSPNPSCQPAKIQGLIPTFLSFSQLVASLHTIDQKCEKHPILEPIINCPPKQQRSSMGLLWDNQTVLCDSDIAFLFHSNEYMKLLHPTGIVLG